MCVCEQKIVVFITLYKEKIHKINIYFVINYYSNREYIRVKYQVVIFLRNFIIYQLLRIK